MSLLCRARHRARDTSGRIRSIDVHRQARAISHGNTVVPFLDHQFGSAHSAALDRRRSAAASAGWLTATAPCDRNMPLDFTDVKYNMDRRMANVSTRTSCFSRGRPSMTARMLERRREYGAASAARSRHKPGDHANLNDAKRDDRARSDHQGGKGTSL